MAGDPKEQQQRMAAAAAAAAGGSIAMVGGGVLQGGIAVNAAAGGPAGTMLDINGQPHLAISVAPGGSITDAAGNVIQLAGNSVQGLPLGMQGLGGQGLLQIDLSRLQELQAAAAQGYAGSMQGVPALQLVQMPNGELAAVAAPQQPQQQLQQQQQGLQDGAAAAAAAAGGEYGGEYGMQLQQQQQLGDHQQQLAGEADDSDRPAKRVRVDDDSQQEQQQLDEQPQHEQHELRVEHGGVEGQDAALGAAGGDVGALDAAAAAAAASGGMQLHLAGQLQQLQQQHGGDSGAAAAAAAAAATALGTVVNVNGVNMLIPAAPQLQLQLASDSSMQEQLQLALQQQVHLTQIPAGIVGMPGLAGVQLPAGIANATPEQLAQLQQQLSIQQQIQQLQLQQQLQLMQLQLASQQGIYLGPGGRLGVDDGGNSHMVRRHGVLPERMVTREMLKQVRHFWCAWFGVQLACVCGCCVSSSLLYLLYLEQHSAAHKCMNRSVGGNALGTGGWLVVWCSQMVETW
jgi:hypothetical protein